MKPARQNIILEIISENSIETQNDLMQALLKKGIKSTQATISRDIKDMHLIKKQGPDGKFIYVSQGKNESDNVRTKLGNIFKECVVSYDIAQNIFVLKTLPGLASAACSALDGMKLEGLVGSLAGDDTAFLAMKDSSAAMNLYYEIEKLLK